MQRLHGIGHVWPLVARLAAGDPVAHAYLLYDTVYELERTSLTLYVDGGRVAGYVLRWASKPCSVIAWGSVAASDVEGAAAGCREGGLVVQLRGRASALAEELAARLSCRLERYVDMAAGEAELAPRPVPRRARIVRLSPLNRGHVEAYRALEEARRGRPVGFAEAVRLVEALRPHGVFVGDVLVSSAGSYVRTRLVWMLGAVYTLPGFRGMGYGGAAVSSVALDAVSMGAVAALHVREDNPARRLYRRLGFSEKGVWPWLLC